MSTREELLKTFTKDAEIDEWVVGDASAEIHGFVDLIEGIKIVSVNGRPTNLFKITVNNGSRKRVKVCFWGEMAKNFSQKFQDRTVVSLECMRTVIPQKKLKNPYDTAEIIELYVLPNTEITIKNIKFEDKTVEKESIEQLEEVDIKDVYNHEKQCYIKGYLKQKFKKITSYGSSFLVGLLVQDDHKISVRISRCDEDKNYDKGTYLKIMGSILQQSQDVSQFVTRSFDDIEHVKSITAKTDDELRAMGYRTPKRKSGTIDGEAYKKGPFD